MHASVVAVAVQGMPMQPMMQPMPPDAMAAAQGMGDPSQQTGVYYKTRICNRWKGVRLVACIGEAWQQSTCLAAWLLRGHSFRRGSHWIAKWTCRRW